MKLNKNIILPVSALTIISQILPVYSFSKTEGTKNYKTQDSKDVDLFFKTTTYQYNDEKEFKNKQKFIDENSKKEINIEKKEQIIFSDVIKNDDENPLAIEIFNLSRSLAEKMFIEMDV